MTHQQTALHPADLQGSGLRLRAWEPGDAEAVLRGLTDPEFLRWNPALRDIVDLSDARDWIARRREAWHSGTSAHYAVEEGGVAVGHVGLDMIELAVGRAKVGYWVVPEARGRGVASRALELCTRWAFDELGLHRLALGHAVGHTASCRVAERCGYPAEGVLRGELPVNGAPGRFHDVHLHARLATDPPPLEAPARG